MRKLVLFAILFLAGINGLFAQVTYKQNFKTLKGHDVVCPGLPEDHFSIIPAPEVVARAKNARANAETKTATFIVEYVNFPENAKAAFQRAVDIWEYLIHSDVPIRVSAYWEQLGTNVLGAANTTDFKINFPGAKKANTYYPIALAEKLAGKPLNSDYEADIYCRFNSAMTWHYGSPETIAAGTYDFTTIVLHELGHGLGFISTMRVTGQNGDYGLGTPYKSIYDIFLETQDGRNLIDTASYDRNSNEMYRILTGNNLYFEKTVGIERPKVYAPTSFSVGSSISHLDDNTYFSGTQNALMTSTARSREVTHDPGPLALAIFHEMGWKTTTIVHDEIKNKLTGAPTKFVVNVLSDTSIVANSAKMHYRTNGQFQTVNLTNTPGTNEYTATVGFENDVTEVGYYFEVQDNYGNTVKIPGSDGVRNDFQYLYSFKIGDDKNPPYVQHTPLQVEEVSYPKDFLVFVDDDFEDAIASVVINYKVNGTTQTPISLSKFDADINSPEYSQGLNDEYLYIIEDGMKGLRTGDHISYQIVATDKSGNKTVIPTEYTSTSASTPTESFYDFTVTSLFPTRNLYATDFENASNDFATIGFSVKDEDGFNSKALHSPHPYRNGLGALDPAGSGGTYLNFERNEIAMLRYPVSIGTGSNLYITFDEVVLVEPGETGSVYGGEEFYDYVVLEGSYDGSTWFPIESGYDSRDNALWERVYNGTMSGGTYPNSLSKGNITLTKKRSMRMPPRAQGGATGTPILLRFRLYSDQFTNGWGWSIDNLYIQEEAPVVLATETEPKSGITLYPNPSVEYLEAEMTLSEPQKVLVEIYSMEGGKVYSEYIQASETVFKHRVGVAGFASGNYVVKIRESKGVAFKRFTKL